MRSTVAIQQHLQHDTVFEKGSWSVYDAVLSLHKSIEKHNKNLVQSSAEFGKGHGSGVLALAPVHTSWVFVAAAATHNAE